MLLGRPTEPKIETVNDLDVWIANFFRALQHDPEQLAFHANWPVNEADLHARHLWLVHQVDFRERMKTDPDYYDVKIAGWWVWGICQWIGSGWCATRGGEGRQDPQGDPWRKKPNIGDGGRGVVADKRPLLTGHTGSVGVHKRSLTNKRPRLGNDHGRGVLCADVPDQIPNLSGDSGAAGRGIHASALDKKMPGIGGRPWGINSEAGMEENNGGGLYEWFYALADRLRRVRVCCGDWKRILGPAPTTCIGTTGVFLDPPYATDDRSDVYGEESHDVAHDVREWAIANGDNPELRIAVCGYEADDYQMPDAWTEIAWKANGGYGNQSNQKTRGRQNAHRERIWFSPYCLNPQANLFTSGDEQ